MMRSYGLCAFVLIGAALSSTGCGALQAVANPGASWALSESPSMTVIVRRAELSRATTEQVDRFLGEPVVPSEGDTFALTEAEAKALLESAAKEPSYFGQPVRVVPSEAWVSAMSSICPPGDGQSLISMLGEDAELAYVEVSTLGREQARLTAEIDALEEKADADGASEAEVAAFQKQIAERELKIEKLKESYEPKANALFAQVGKLAAAASEDAKIKMAPLVFHLSEAVEDAQQANAAAVVRYPLAMPAITDDLQWAARRFAADVLEEQTGHRPDMTSLSPQIAIDGTDVSITLNGIPDDKLGEVDSAALIAETTARTQEYFGVALGLLSYASETQERLSFQEDLLEAWREGLGAQPKAGAIVDITDLQVVTAAPTPSPHEGGPADAAAASDPAVSTARRSPGGLRVTTCETPATAPEAAPLAGK